MNCWRFAIVRLGMVSGATHFFRTLADRYSQLFRQGLRDKHIDRFHILAEEQSYLYIGA